MSNKVNILGLPAEYDESRVKQLFSVYGTVIDAKIIKNIETGRSRGFGFVTFADSNDAKEAKKSLDGLYLDGRTIRVDMAQERKEPPSPAKRFRDIEERIEILELEIYEAMLLRQELQAAAEYNRKIYNDEVKSLESQFLDSQEWILAHIWVASMAPALSGEKLIRYIPIRISVPDKVPTNQERLQIVAAVEELLEGAGFEKAFEFREIFESWWKSFCAKTKRFFTSDEVQNTLDKVKSAVEMEYIDKPQAEANKTNAEAAALIIESLSSTTRACAQLGSLLVIKYKEGNGDTIIKCITLNYEQIKYLEENKQLLKKPEEAACWFSLDSETSKAHYDNIGLLSAQARR